jgi:FG-GAP-like repeat
VKCIHNNDDRQGTSTPTPPMDGLDLAVANNFGDSVSILLGNGDGTFDPANNFPTGNSPYAIAIGDFNGDGVLDLVTANESSNSNSVSILLGNGDGTFGPANNFPRGGTTPRFVAVGDFNGDNVLDLAVANTGSHDLGILLGNGDGTFGPANNFQTGEESFPTFVAVGDFNDDDVLDLVTVYDNLGETNSNSVTILLGNDDGTFNSGKYFRVGTSPMAVAVEDFNGDSVLDLAVANSGSAGSVSILLGNGDGTFGQVTSFEVGNRTFSVAVGEFN